MQILTAWHLMMTLLVAGWTIWTVSIWPYLLQWNNKPNKHTGNYMSEQFHKCITVKDSWKGLGLWTKKSCQLEVIHHKLSSFVGATSSIKTTPIYYNIFCLRHKHIYVQLMWIFFACKITILAERQNCPANLVLTEKNITWTAKCVYL